MTASHYDDDARLADPQAMLSDLPVADLIATLRQLTDALELHHATRVEAQCSVFDERQLDIWNGSNPF